MKRSAGTETRFGISEWYGKPFVGLTPEERRHLAQIQFLPKSERPPMPCPFLSRSTEIVRCSKEGGVCALRQYQRAGAAGQVSVGPGPTMRTTCPSRFEENGKIHQWIGEVLLNSSDSVPVGQVNFLERVPLAGVSGAVAPTPREVGRFDNILVVPNTRPLQWCPLEIQAVYFSGDRMEKDFRGILEHGGGGLPFPAGRRRPDYRSSGPKRLMPQLQIKVPTLRRWGKKIAVLVDEDFFKAMGQMEVVADMSNCDVAWFVVRYEEAGGSVHLTRGGVYLTTLEESVQSLIAGRPMSQARFEERILAKLSRGASGPPEVSPNK